MKETFTIEQAQELFEAGQVTNTITTAPEVTRLNVRLHRSLEGYQAELQYTDFRWRLMRVTEAMQDAIIVS